ncbi:MAG TPA: hypothetical protein VKP30_16315 [Polyangiaceae bacterium]|nr:hypothetical protein [Polyangiaceae bacterium]
MLELYLGGTVLQGGGTSVKATLADIAEKGRKVHQVRGVACPMSARLSGERCQAGGKKGPMGLHV